MEHPKTRDALWNLPKEIRLYILEYALCNIGSNAFYIRKFIAGPRWRLCYDPDAQVPGILLVSKAIHAEAMAVLHSVSIHNPPRIVIDYLGTAYHAGIMQPDLLEARRGYKIRDLETIIPVLKTVTRLNLEIRELRDDEHCIILVRWLVAVLNHRPNLVSTVDLGVHIANGYYNNVDRSGLLNELSKLQSRSPITLWALKRARVDIAQGPPLGEPLSFPTSTDQHDLGTWSEQKAWRALCFAKSSYYVNKMAEEYKKLVNPSERLHVQIYCALSDIWEAWEQRDTDC